MNKKTAEMFATALSHIGIIPSFDGAFLFTDDITDITGFQIQCKTNETGRMVFSFVDHENYPNAYRTFVDKYEEIHGNKIRNSTKHDINQPTYPAFGADYIIDLSPATIVRILRVQEENSNEMVGILPAYILQLTKEIKRWEDQFKKMYENTSTLRQTFEQIFEESF